MKYFKMEEFNCKCGCGLNNMTITTLLKLESARNKAGIPFNITSASRCKEHNKSVGGAVDSQHLHGIAVDISCSDSADRLIIISALLANGFTGIGIAKHFIHADTRDIKKGRPVCWLY